MTQIFSGERKLVLSEFEADSSSGGAHEKKYIFILLKVQKYPEIYIGVPITTIEGESVYRETSRRLSQLLTLLFSSLLFFHFLISTLIFSLRADLRTHICCLGLHITFPITTQNLKKEQKLALWLCRLLALVHRLIVNHILSGQMRQGSRLRSHAVHLSHVKYTDSDVKGMFHFPVFTFPEIFLSKEKTAPESRLQKFHWPSQQQQGNRHHATERPQSLHNLVRDPLGCSESLENKPFLTCNIYMTAIELRCLLRLSLKASFLNCSLEIPAFGKSDT